MRSIINNHLLAVGLREARWDRQAGNIAKAKAGLGGFSR
jgi:hypothetical protein